MKDKFFIFLKNELPRISAQAGTPLRSDELQVGDYPLSAFGGLKR